MASHSHVGVSKNRGTPKSSILIRFSIINHPFWGTPIFGNTHVLVYHGPLQFSTFWEWRSDPIDPFTHYGGVSECWSDPWDEFGIFTGSSMNTIHKNQPWILDRYIYRKSSLKESNWWMCIFGSKGMYFLKGFGVMILVAHRRWKFAFFQESAICAHAAHLVFV